MIKEIESLEEVLVKKRIVHYECDVCQRRYKIKENAERHNSLHKSLPEVMNLLFSGKTLCVYPEWYEGHADIDYTPELFVKFEEDGLRFLAVDYLLGKSKLYLLDKLLHPNRLVEVLSGVKLELQHQKILDIYGKRNSKDILFYNVWN